MTPNHNLSQVARQVQLGWQKSAAPAEAISLQVHGTVTQLETNLPALTDAVKGFLAKFRATDAQPEHDISFHIFAVDELEPEMVPVATGTPLLYDWGEVKLYHSGFLRLMNLGGKARVMADVKQRTAVAFVHRSWAASPWLVAHLIFYPLWGQLLKELGLFPFHAAGLVHGEHAFLFPGRSGSGKSTLSLHLVRGGYRMLGDDTVFLKRSGDRVIALAFPEEVNITEQTREMLPELSQVESFTFNPLRQKQSFAPEELYPDCFAERANPVIMMFPQLSGEETTRIDEIDNAEALGLAMRYGLFFLDPSTQNRHFEVLSRLVMQTGCYKLLSGSDRQELERAVDKILSDHPGNSDKLSS